MSESLYKVCVDSVDPNLLDLQREALRLDIDNAYGEHKEYLEGIEALLDHIADKIYHSKHEYITVKECINEKKE